MTDSLFGAVAQASRELMKYGFATEKFAAVVQRNKLTDAEVLALAKVFDCLMAKKESARVEFLLRTSRLPLKAQKIFDNLDHWRNVERLRSLPTLSAIYAHKNLAFIGRLGTSKTHLPRLLGAPAVSMDLKPTSFKMTELRDRMISARRAGRESSLLSSLVRPSCLIIDEVGHCEFDQENTRLFFDMVDRRYQKEGCSNMVLPATGIPPSGRKTSARTMLSCALWTASLMMPWSLPRGRASMAGSWRRFPCAQPPALPLHPGKPNKLCYPVAVYTNWRFSSGTKWLISPDSNTMA